MGEIPVIKAALLGAGTVGGGVYEILERQREEMPRKLGAFVEITKILVRDKKKQRPGMEAACFTEDWKEILEDSKIQIVIELMGGIEPARTYILQALEAGKHVVTANKDLMAEHGRELMDAAKHSHCDLQFEAAVGGGIPIIRPLKECLAGNEITEVMGIVNGTTNYILTRMTEDGMDFAEALKKAQELGFAEADPTSDIEGLDAGRKMAILASIAFHSRVTFSDVDVKGITGITAKDIQYAKEFGYTLKLLGVARNTDGEMEVGVFPMMIPSTHPLAHVKDAFNAVFVHGDAVDDAMFQGKGAGELPTASAVMGDLIAVVRNMQYACCGRIGCSCYRDLPMKASGESRHRYFLRLIVEDRTGILAGVAGVLGNNNVSINQVIQKPAVDGVAELVVITDKVENRHLKDALVIFGEMSMIREVASVIRVYSGR